MNLVCLTSFVGSGFAYEDMEPSAERECEILAHIHKLGKEMLAACF